MRSAVAFSFLPIQFAVACSAANEREGREPLVVSVVVAPSVPPPASAPASATSARPAPTLLESTVTNLRAMRLERCDTSAPGARKLDLNGDGNPDVVEVRVNGKVVCRRMDLTADGVPEVTQFFDANGKVRRLERDFDNDGLVDEVVVWSGAPPSCVSMIDTDQDGMADQIKRIDCPNP